MPNFFALNPNVYKFGRFYISAWNTTGKDTSTDKVPELWLFTIRFMPPNKAWSLPRWLGAVYTQLLIIFDAITARLITPS